MSQKTERDERCYNCDKPLFLLTAGGVSECEYCGAQYENADGVLKDEIKTKRGERSSKKRKEAMQAAIDESVMAAKKEIAFRQIKREAERATAPAILEAGAKHLADRAAARDQENGERAMGQIVAAFNAIYGTDLTEVMGWQFMVLLKMARSANGKTNPDDYEDGAAYFALAGEAALRDAGKEDEA